MSVGNLGQASRVAPVYITVKHVGLAKLSLCSIRLVLQYKEMFESIVVMTAM